MSLSHISKFLFVCIFGITLTSCGGEDPFFLEDDFSEVPEPFDTTGAPRFETETGLVYYVLEEGQGPFNVTIRDDIAVFFTGRTTDGKIFDSSYNRGNTQPIISSVQGFIPGFIEGTLGMKIGEKRVFVIPPELGYADAPRGSQNFEFRDDTLIFDVELDDILDP